MSGEVQYEEVPQEDLQDHQRFFVNKEKEAPSWEGGATALAAKGLYKGAPAATRAVIDRIKGPSASQSTQPQASVTVEAGPTEPTTPYSTWNQKLAGNAAPGSQMNKRSLDVNQRMMETIGPGGEFAGGEIHGNSILLPPNMKPATPSAQAAPEVAEELRGLLTPTERALQAVRGMGSKAMPYLEKADPYLRAAGLFGAGTTGMEAMKRFRHGDYGRGALDLIGMAGATAASLPVKNPLTTIGGAGVALSAEAINKLLDQYYGREYAAGGQIAVATGGLVSLD